MDDGRAPLARGQAPIVLGILIAAVAIHVVPFYSYLPGDHEAYVIYWYRHIIEHGWTGPGAQPFSNYTPPYLYLLTVATFLDGWVAPSTAIKLLACAGAGWLAFAIYRLLRSVGAKDPWVGAAGSLLLPSVILNVSVLGQADTFWVAPCVLTVAAAVRGKLAWVALWSGLAFAFKAQAVFIAPFVFYVLFAKRAPWWCWAIPAAVYVAAMLPAWAAGWPAWYLIEIYPRQARFQPEDRIFISNGASWWTIYGYLFPGLALKIFYLGYGLAAAGVTAYLGFLRRRPLSAELMVAAATVSAAGVPWLLPGMHERFFILADILAYSYMFVARTPRSIAIALMMQLGSALPGYGWAYRLPDSVSFSACFFVAAAILLLFEDLARGGNAGRAPSRRVVQEPAAARENGSQACSNVG